MMIMMMRAKRRKGKEKKDTQGFCYLEEFYWTRSSLERASSKSTESLLATATTATAATKQANEQMKFYWL